MLFASASLRRYAIGVTLALKLSCTPDYKTKMLLEMEKHFVFSVRLHRALESIHSEQIVQLRFFCAQNLTALLQGNQPAPVRFYNFLFIQ